MNGDSLTVKLHTGSHPGKYTFPFKEGWSLDKYLRASRLINAARRSRVWDETYPEKGPVRFSYVPQPDSVINIGGRNPVARFQRSSVDAHAVARGMGGGQRNVQYRIKQTPSRTIRETDDNGVESI